MQLLFVFVCGRFERQKYTRRIKRLGKKSISGEEEEDSLKYQNSSLATTPHYSTKLPQYPDLTFPPLLHCVCALRTLLLHLNRTKHIECQHLSTNSEWHEYNHNQLSADEDDFLATPSFSAAFSASPPAFPREGGPPPPSPRVTRGWSHQNRPVRRCPSIERDLPYTAVVRQLDTSSRRAQTLRRANEALGARVNDLESGAVLRATKARLSERDEVR